MSKKSKALILGLMLVGIIGLIAALLRGHNIAVLSPKGTIAEQQRHLMIIGSLLALIIVVPVFTMTFVIAWKYRAGNHKAKYAPDWDHSRAAETTWWLVPLALILVLSVIAWKSSHDLDPHKPLNSSVKPLTVQVIALDWKWLFIYPEQNIATVNHLQLPVHRPVNFEITADAPMNSFWIPNLGGQIYAMSGMSTHLHLEASETGNFNGLSANISGRGFAGMRFVAAVSTAEDFDKWVSLVKRSPNQLTLAEYEKLAKPSENNPATYYSSATEGLYDKVVIKYAPYGHGMREQ